MEQKRNILDLSNAIKCTPENTKCSQGARSERLKMIENFELKFDVKLPSSYISYITSVDWAPKIFDEINYLNNTGIKLDLVEINYELRNEDISYPTIPNYLIAISRGHDDNYFCFDTRYISDGEYPLAYWSSYTPFYKELLEQEFSNIKLAQALFTYIAPDFATYFYNILCDKE